MYSDKEYIDVTNSNTTVIQLLVLDGLNWKYTHSNVCSISNDTFVLAVLAAMGLHCAVAPLAAQLVSKYNALYTNAKSTNSTTNTEPTITCMTC
jgi:hypothetical protein